MQINTELLGLLGGLQSQATDQCLAGYDWSLSVKVAGGSDFGPMSDDLTGAKSCVPSND